MWAVIEIGKRQYKVEKGQTLSVQRLKQEGKTSFDKVLLLCKDDKVEVGTPYLKNVKVEADILGEKKSEKVIVYKYKRRKKYRKRRGHRQILTHLKISNIVKSK